MTTWNDRTDLDYDLRACLDYNPQPEIEPEAIKAVLAVWEGENDGPDWRWIVRLTDGRVAYIRGGCDYTGWDCQSWATSVVMAPGSPIVQEEDDLEVRNDLWRQLYEGKDQTWREEKDAEMDIKQGIQRLAGDERAGESDGRG